MEGHLRPPSRIAAAYRTDIQIIIPLRLQTADAEDGRCGLVLPYQGVREGHFSHGCQRSKTIILLRRGQGRTGDEHFPVVVLRRIPTECDRVGEHLQRHIRRWDAIREFLYTDLINIVQRLLRHRAHVVPYDCDYAVIAFIV